MKKRFNYVKIICLILFLSGCLFNNSPINIGFTNIYDDESFAHGEDIYVNVNITIDEDQFDGISTCYIDNAPIDTFFYNPFTVIIVSSDYQLGEHVLKVVAEQEDDQGQAEIHINFTGNAPEAVFSVFPTSGTVDNTFIFNATASTDVEDDITTMTYQWDFDEDGIWDGVGRIACYQFDTQGNYDVKLRVKDSGGAYDETIERVSVSSGSGNIPEGYALVEHGSFYMFKTETYDGRFVTLTNDLYMGICEISYSQFIEFMNDAGVSENGFYNGNDILDLDPIYTVNIIYSGGSWQFSATSYNREEDCPASSGTWYGALEYCNWLSEEEGLTPCYTISEGTSSNQGAVICNWSANGYRLPTEAEWEFAARGGIHSYRDFPYAGSYDKDAVAVYNHYSNVIYGSYPGGERLPNELGICDMSGNMSEWCWDRYASQPSDIASDPRGPETGGARVNRGGHFSDIDPYISKREGYNAYWAAFVGFRVVRLAQ